MLDGVKFDGEKPKWDLVPWDGMEPVARVLTLGARKYSPDNWRKVPDGRTRYLAAAFRHLVAHARGEVLDPESKEPHLAHCVCCLLFILAWPGQSRELIKPGRRP